MTTSVTDDQVIAALQAYISETGTVDSRDGDLLHIDHEGMRAALEAALRSQGKVVEVAKLEALRDVWKDDAPRYYVDCLTAIIGEGD